MPVISLTYELIEKIKKQKEEKKEQYNALEKKTIQSIWEEDIEEFLKALQEYEDKEEEERDKFQGDNKGAIRKKRAGKAKAKPKEPDSAKRPKRKEPSSARSNQKKGALMNPVQKQKAEKGEKAMGLMERLKNRNPDLQVPKEALDLRAQLGQKRAKPKFGSEASSPAVMGKSVPKQAGGGGKAKKTKKNKMMTDDSDEEEEDYSEDSDY